jgi:hypothetical protein
MSANEKRQLAMDEMHARELDHLACRYLFRVTSKEVIENTILVINVSSEPCRTHNAHRRWRWED